MIVAMDELRAHRREWGDDEVDQLDHFYVDSRGGGGTKRATGVASDCVACFARSHVRGWCKRFGCQIMHSFSFLAHAGPEACYLLAREWCGKQNLFYQRWLDEGSDPNFDFGAVEWYDLSDEFYEALDLLDPTLPTFQRFTEVAAWIPAVKEI